MLFDFYFDGILFDRFESNDTTIKEALKRYKKLNPIYPPKLLSCKKHKEINMETLVKTGDTIERDGIRYSVIIADNKVFVISKQYRTENDTLRVRYDQSEVYSNLKSVNTLETLRMTIVE